MTTVADLPAGTKVLTTPGSWSFGYDLEGNNEVRGTFQVPFAQLEAFRNVCLYTPQVYVLNPDPLVQVTRIAPLVCPLDKKLVALTVEGGNFQPNFTSDQTGPWQQDTDGTWIPNQTNPPFGLFSVVVRFGRQVYATTGEQAFLDVTEEDRIERRTIPNHPYVLRDSGGTQVERVAQDIALPAGTSLFRLTWHQLNDIPGAQGIFQPILDRVNNADVTIPILGAQCPKGTLHCAGKAATASINTGNVTKGTISATLAYFYRGWNKAVASVSPHIGEYLDVDPRPFEEADFGPLFYPTS